MKNERAATRSGILTGLLLFVFVSAVLGQANAVQYFYDDAGRLNKVVDPSGSIATYNYDAVGNLLSISRSTVAANGPTILSFTPQQGAPGQVVTIQGEGFSATPSADVVKFNGTAATVSAATTTSLTVAVPAGATTGLLSVTLAGVTATSDKNFIVSTLQSIRVTPAISGVALNATQQFKAIGTFSNGAALDISGSVVWSSSSPTAATISNSVGTAGVATGVGVGSTTITATGGSVSGSAVLAVALLNVSVSPVGETILTGKTQQFTASAYFQTGNSQDVTKAVTWSSSNPGVATVSNAAGSQGLATGTGFGTTTITATNGSVSGSTLFTVAAVTGVAPYPSNIQIPVRGTTQFVAQILTTNAVPITLPVTWSSSDTTVLTISNAPGSQGLAVAVGDGTANVCASITYGSTFSNCSRVMTYAAIQSIALNATDVTLPAGAKQVFTATGTFSDGSVRDITDTAAWQSSDPTVATVTSVYFPGVSGITKAIKPGTVTITANFDPISATATVTVTPAAPTSITVAPAGVLIAPGGARQFTASAAMTDGSRQDMTQSATWTTSDPTIVDISNTAGSQGGATGVNKGAAAITATLGSLTGSANVLVNAGSGSIFPRFAYTANSTDSTISIYAVDAVTGQFRANGYFAEPTGTKPLAVALDPANKFLFVANSGSGNVAVYSVNPANGALTQVTGSPFNTGLAPKAVVVDPTANFVYVVNSGDSPGDVSAFAYSPTTGALTAVPGQPFQVGSSANGAATDPAGKFLYVTDANDGNIWAFTIAPTTGALTTVTNQPFSAGTNPTPITVDPTGRFVLVGNGTVRHGSQLLPFPGIPGAESLSALGTGRSTDSYHANGVAFRLTAYRTASAGRGLGFLSRAFAAPEPLPAPQGGGGGVNPGSGVSVFTIDPTTGALTAVSGSPFSDGTTEPATSVTVDPTGNYAYATLSNGGLAAFAITPTVGTLTLLSGSPYPTGFGPTSVAVDPSGLFTYVTDPAAGVTDAFAINPGSGALVTLASEPSRQGAAGIAISSGAAAVQSTPRFAYVASSGGSNLAGTATGSNNIFGFTIDPVTGGLTSITSSPFAEGLSPVFGASDLLGRFLYLGNKCSTSGCSGAGTVSAFDVSSGTGALTVASGSPFAAGTAPSGVAVDPSGRFTYVANSTDDTISAYSLDQTTGALTAISGSPFTLSVSGIPSAVAIDPTGQFLFVLVACPQNSTCSSDPILEYQISPTNGTLSLLSSLVLGGSSSSLAIEPRGKFVYVTDSASNTVTAVALQTFGLVLPGNPTFQAALAPSSVAVDPTGSFLYVANTGSNSISAYTIDAGGSGALTEMTGSPFPSGINPVSVSIDASGKFVYVVNEGDNTVSAFSIDPASGALTPLAGSPFAAGTVPISIVTTGKTQ